MNLKKQDAWNKSSQDLLDIYKKVVLEKEKQIELENKAKGIIESVKTKEEKRLEYVKEMEELKEKGLLTQAQYDSAINLNKDKGSASAIEINRSVSIKGMAIGGVEDKQAETNRLLQEVNRTLKETKSILVMN
jgi:hypothetical protein